jgi:hypothetical protein
MGTASQVAKQISSHRTLHSIPLSVLRAVPVAKTKYSKPGFNSTDGWETSGMLSRGHSKKPSADTGQRHVSTRRLKLRLFHQSFGAGVDHPVADGGIGAQRANNPPSMS